jgi:hypothetical protein
MSTVGSGVSSEVASDAWSFVSVAVGSTASRSVVIGQGAEGGAATIVRTRPATTTMATAIMAARARRAPGITAGYR